MNNSFRGVLFFIMGAASASFITYKLVEKKFKVIADEEIKSVKEMYERKLKKLELDKYDESKLETLTIAPDGSSDSNEMQQVRVNPYGSLVTNLGYAQTEKEEKESVSVDRNIVVIPPEDFGEYGYKCESLTYYKDQVLTNDYDEKITDIDKIVGPEALHTFGEYEDDSVFVRNHDLKTDYEILFDTRRFSDVVGDDE